MIILLKFYIQVTRLVTHTCSTWGEINQRS